MTRSVDRLVRARGLQARVVERCGRSDQFRSLGPAFADWLLVERRGSTQQVEAALAEYLDRTARTGRWWGLRLGLVYGLVAGLAMLAVVMLPGPR